MMSRQSTLGAWMAPKKRPPTPDSDCQIVEESADVPKRRRLSLKKRRIVRGTEASHSASKEEKPPDPPSEEAVKTEVEEPSSSQQPTKLLSPQPHGLSGSGDESSQPPPPLAKSDSQASSVEFAVPYYLENFVKIVDSVLDDDYHRSLFSDDELRWKDDFHALPEAAKKLFIRLFGRKNRWLRAGQIKYDKIDTDLRPWLDTLVQDGFLQSDVSGEDLATLLDLLSAPELSQLGKEYKLRPGARRHELLAGLLDRAARKSLSMFAGVRTVKEGLVKRVRSLLGRCFRVESGRRSFFNRLLLLHSLTSAALDDDDSGQAAQKELFEMLRVAVGLVKYPAYETWREARIFAGREDLLHLERLHNIEAQIAAAADRKEFEAAAQLCEQFEEEFVSSGKFQQLSRHAASLPTFLRSLTPGARVVSLVATAAEVAEKRRRYDHAERHLRWLLAQDLFHAPARPRWWDRLTLDLERHLRRPRDALTAARQAMSDPHVVGGHRLSIHARGERLSAGKSDEPWPAWPLLQPAHVEIEGRLLPNAPVWLHSADDTLLCGVEQLALQHYHDAGFPRGVHGESGSVWTLCALLLWNVFFLSGPALPDAFVGPHQAAPLDLNDAAFFARRREAVEGRLAWLEAADEAAVRAEMGRVWAEHGEERGVGLNPDLFASAEDAADCALCIGGVALAGLFRRLVGAAEAAPVGGGRHWRSGMPDLLVWSPADRRYRFVEVKGPTDRLSTKQQLWLDAMLRLGINAEVCHVRAVGAKRLKKTGEDG